jgi:hypothetical protein
MLHDLLVELLLRTMMLSNAAESVLCSGLRRRQICASLIKLKRERCTILA